MISELTRELYRLSIRARRMGKIESFTPRDDKWKITDHIFKRSMKKEKAKEWLKDKIK